ncbi:anthranilate synthase component I family protein [Arenibacter palladensis]|uniref:anthranilate synthase component I family protein n=1 Tax=Arenibacter palladensis TaxID=237373 RepID=UPI0026E15C70|nr:anthranilate synthase component I family protein [Arenibacter palladensis]MDO6602072.1 anthranilate synthase component I family protein [Arenibacter palladensis]
MRKKVSFTVPDIVGFKQSLLHWSQQYYEVVWLDSNGHRSKYSSFDGMLAVDALTSVVTDTTNAFEDLSNYQKNTKDWIFGYLSYDLKNDTEILSSSNADSLNFPELFFFQPKKLIEIKETTVSFHYLNMVVDEIEEDFKNILEATRPFPPELENQSDIRIKLRIFKDEYFSRVNKMLNHIHRGDIYEANFCQEFYAENTEIDALKTYLKLNSITRAPFSAFLKINDKYLLSSSPERYIKKLGNKVISQPIKGTAKRSLDSVEDQLLVTALEKDEKERAENIMIVDLVRNDLSKSALKGSVKVEELCKVYSFDQVHQMISTVTAEVSSTKNPVDIIKETFPMGSMTGAPKVSAMRIIEELEASKRGLYSGTVGYFTPENDFDFNVVIRSILYNKTAQYVSFSVGSAITAKAIPEKEYEECLLKAKAMRQVLEN